MIKCYRLAEGLQRWLVRKLRREEFTTFTEGLYLVRYGRFTVSVFAKKNSCVWAPYEIVLQYTYIRIGYVGPRERLLIY